MNVPSRHVLLVENSSADAHLVEELLSRAKRIRFAVEWVRELDAGLARLAQGGIDAVLFDLLVDRGRGLEALSCLRAQYPTVPVVVLSTLDLESRAAKSVHGGAQDYLIKEDLEASVLEHAVRYAIERKRVDEVLRDTEARYQSLVESLPLNVFRKDLDGRLVFANQLYCQQMRRSWPELEGQTDWDLFPPHLAEKYRSDDAAVLASGTVF